LGPCAPALLLLYAPNVAEEEFSKVRKVQRQGS
jgi:hypothetical protein